MTCQVNFDSRPTFILDCWLRRYSHFLLITSSVSGLWWGSFPSFSYRKSPRRRMTCDHEGWLLTDESYLYILLLSLQGARDWLSPPLVSSIPIICGALRYFLLWRASNENAKILMRKERMLNVRLKAPANALPKLIDVLLISTSFFEERHRLEPSRVCCRLSWQDSAGGNSFSRWERETIKWH